MLCKTFEINIIGPTFFSLWFYEFYFKSLCIIKKLRPIEELKQ